MKLYIYELFAFESGSYFWKKRAETCLSELLKVCTLIFRNLPLPLKIPYYAPDKNVIFDSSFKRFGTYEYCKGFYQLLKRVWKWLPYYGHSCCFYFNNPANVNDLRVTFVWKKQIIYESIFIYLFIYVFIYLFIYLFIYTLLNVDKL